MATHKPISRSGRFKKGPDAEVRAYSESISFDWRLYRQDIAGSIAHATMLARVKLIRPGERNAIVRGLKRIEKEIDAGRFRWNADLEDVHMNIESALTTRVPAAARLHTARSRNDQVATDLRLWVRDETLRIQGNIRKLQRSLVKMAMRSRLPSRGSKTKKFLVIPGYTHLQRAQPVTAALHLLAYVEMLARDFDRFADCAARSNICPLGSGALATSSLPVDRKLTAKLLGFDRPSSNSMDSVSDRDFVAEFEFAAALTGVHLSRLAEDWIIWSSAEFSFLEIGDSHTTGSSLMPQKKNPDVAELARGKTGRLIGNLVSILTMLKGLPMTYNRDLQEDKEPLFDSADTLNASLSVTAGMVEASRFRVTNCSRAASDINLLATELADYLVRKGVAFRQAHHAVGEAVRYAEENRKTLADLSFAEWKKIHPAFGKDVRRALELDRALERRNSIPGSPGPTQVAGELRRWEKLLRS